ncbi:probable protein phosphatase 2C 25 [Cucurbita maxima]|uniref:protein-serine/threonine phosphatase n=1 Tax=Cucurbita maxima TaxID=3661 RepID=A0A6J1K8E1_CUCMA|nr:probable protein phosphatase 2C 25 [Cucurbita maxima]
MSVSVAVSNSPGFSPSSSMFCNKAAIISPAPEALTLTLAHLKSSQPSSSCSSSPSSPSSPFWIRFPKPPSGLSAVAPMASTSSSTSPTSSNAITKRKRPARLDIPLTPLSFGALVSPSSSFRDVMEAERDGYSVYCKRGRRRISMEDRYSAAVDLRGDSKEAFFGVFDGHGGAKAAEFAANNLKKNIMNELERITDYEQAIKHGYLTTDSDFLKEDQRGGSCCVTALIKKGNLIISNAGDCRAVLSSEGVAEAITSDHRPSREDERQRIESRGGYVDLCNGVWRVQGSLAVTRGIGDAHLKQWVIAEPETTSIRIEARHEFLILASDGLWETVSNQEAVDIVRPSCVGIEKATPLEACKKLVELSLSRGSVDDISVVLIQLPNFI